MSKIMRVYYDNAGLPYKDSALSTLYPIVGSEFTGANNTTEIHFYCDNLGQATWVANCKLPNGEKLNRLLVVGVDSDGLTYQSLPLDSQLTSIVGHLKIGLNGYAGNISIDEEELENYDLIVISGTPTIIATGIIDIAMNYSPIVIPVSDLQPNEYQELLALIGTKLNSASAIMVIENHLTAIASAYPNNQVVYDKTDHLFYRVVDNAFVLEEVDIWDMEYNGISLLDILNSKVEKTATPNRLYGTDGSGNQKTYTIDEIAQTVADVPSKQMTTTVIRNALTNINGRVLTAYEQETTTVGGYNAIIIKKGGNQLTEEQARDYMEYMTGSRFLPQYDYGKPQNSIFIMANGTFWKPQYADNALVLYEISNPFELINNKVSTLSASNTDTQYPSAKVVYDNLVNVREVAEGKTNSYVLSYQATAPSTTAEAQQYKTLDGTYFDTLSDFLGYVEYGDEPGILSNSILNSQSLLIDLDDGAYFITSDKTVIKFTDFQDVIKTGDVFIVSELEVPDRWWDRSNLQMCAMETAKVDLINYYAKNASLIPTATNTYNLGSAAATYKDLYLDGHIYLGNADIRDVGNFLTISGRSIKSGDLLPIDSASFLGSNGSRWKDIYLSGAIKGAATITQAQYDALVSGGTVDADTFYFIEEE